MYSPHTAVDCTRGGLGDWLADIVTGTPTELSDVQQEAEDNNAVEDTSGQDGLTADAPQPARRPVYMLQHHPSQMDLNDEALALGDKKHKRYPIVSTKVEGYPGAGMGRIVRLPQPVALTEIIDRIGLGLGNPKGFPIAVPQGKQTSDMQISSIGICAGSGGHLFGEMDGMGEEVDMLFTGELSHHEALAQIERGRCVICLFHSNTERGFLHSVMKGQLEGKVKEEVSSTWPRKLSAADFFEQWERIRNEEKAKDGISEEFLEALNDDNVEVHVSEVDRDPYGVMIAKAEV